MNSARGSFVTDEVILKINRAVGLGLLTNYRCFQRSILAQSTPATISKQHCPMLQVERFFRQSRMLLWRCCRFGQQCCQFGNIVERNFVLSTHSKQNKHTGNTVAKTGNSAAGFGNNIIEATLDFVERTKFYEKLVRHCCRFWQQCRMWLWQTRTLFVWTGLYRLRRRQTTACKTVTTHWVGHYHCCCGAVSRSASADVPVPENELAGCCKAFPASKHTNFDSFSVTNR